jgi:hypothetical protein
VIWVALAYEGTEGRVDEGGKGSLKRKAYASGNGWVDLPSQWSEKQTTISCCSDGVMVRKNKGARTSTSNKMPQHRIAMGWLAWGEQKRIQLSGGDDLPNQGTKGVGERMSPRRAALPSWAHQKGSARSLDGLTKGSSVKNPGS